MIKSHAAQRRLAVAAIVTVLLLILLGNAINQPVATALNSYNAQFTDISGLHTGADVRVRGVRVGKVSSIELRQDRGRSTAQVDFTLEKRFTIVDSTRLAIKYQALTGLRYVDVVGAIEGPDKSQQFKAIPTSMTQPSFDITTLFNGLQPVLATLSPDELNRFTDNVAALLEGDGSGLEPVLDSIHNLSRLASDRQQVVGTLVQNLTTLSNATGGRANDLIQIITWLSRPIDGAMTVLDEFRKSQIYGPGFTSAVVTLLDSAGIKQGADIDAALDKAFTNVNDMVDAFKRVPVIWENIEPPPAARDPMPCSHGQAQFPLAIDVLLNGQKVVLCNK